MKKFCFLLLLLFLCTGLVGCAETNLLERIGLTTLIGYDFGKEKEVETTAVVRHVSTELQSKVTIITAENETSQGTRAEINHRAAEKILSGQLRSVLFGDEFTKEGIGHYIDAMLRNPAVSGGTLLAVVEGESKTLLEYTYPNIDDIGEHIFKMLNQNIESEEVVSSTLHEVAHDYYSVGRDIAMPIIKREAELVMVSGIALFKKDKMIGKLSIDDSFYVKLSRDDFHAGTYELQIKGDDVLSSLLKNPPDKINLVFDPLTTHKDLKLVDPTTPEIDLRISMQARLLEIKPSIEIGEAHNKEVLEKVISKSLAREFSRVLADCQEVGSDVFGFGEFYRSSLRHSNLTEKEWDEMFKTMKVNVHVDFTVLRGGTFE